MINILLTRKHSYTVAPVGKFPQHTLTELIRPLPYEQAVRDSSFLPGCYIFSDLDRLATGGRRLADDLHRHLSADARNTILNHPSRSLTRLALQQRLEEEGINPFRARSLDRWRELTFPIFLREQDDHNGPITPLLRSKDEVEHAIQRLRLKGMTARHLMAVEFCDTADERGVIKKYGTFRIGERFVPRHLFATSDWLAKRSGPQDEAIVKEELRFVESNPHGELLRPIFDIANIHYGRMDYSFLNGRPVVWEINLNPQLGPTVPRPGGNRHLRQPAKKINQELLKDALAELDERTRTDDPARIEVRSRPSLVARIAFEADVQKARRGWFALMRRVADLRRKIRPANRAG
ncbi:MAG: hypothetical protein QOK47_1452 [Actinomycetota bacterium]|nr:hypothetical protein [Actinomycetota bacterium]